MLDGVGAELVALVLLAAVLLFATVRPRALSEATAALPAAALVLALDIVEPRAAAARVLELGPTVAFLAVILLLAHLAEVDGVFSWLGSQLAVRSDGRPRRLLGVTFAAATVTTAVLSLDATVVLLTPVVFATAATLQLRARPHVDACTHPANSASLLLPVSNLTNLLAFAASGLSFLGFAALMALPWLVAIAVELLVFRRYFTADLASAPAPGIVLAVLIGVNIGPNLTYVGSLATLMWRRALAGSDAAPALGEFLRLGIRTVPAALLAAVFALWGA